MDPVIIDNFITDEESDELSAFLDSLSAPSPRLGISGALGYPSSMEAAKVGTSRPAINGFEDHPQEFLVRRLEKIILDVRAKLEDHFGVDMDLVNCSYQLMTEGGRNPLHSDTTELDGSPIQADGSPEELEWSALLYMSNYGEDYEGGTIVFPKQEVEIFPMKSQLLFFKGDIDHIHEVLPVTSGSRKNLVFFYGRRGNSSDSSFFTV